MPDWRGSVQLERDPQLCFEASKVVIIVDPDQMEPTAAFLYLGRTVAYNNSN